MNTTKVSVKLSNAKEFDLFGSFIQGSGIPLSYSDNISLTYECVLNDFEMVIAKTQYRSIVAEL